jgi:NADPH:quinone reductase-like Zn-dependent oxidoreductase
MKAIQFTEYGSPDVLQFKDVEKPTPKENQVLVKVHAASANALDWHMMRGSPFLVRMGNGLRHPKDHRLGADIAGQVEAVGAAVTQFQPGDSVFGVCAGGYAEYGCTPAKNLVPKPEKLSFEEAAAVPVAALTALQGLRDKGHIQAGQKVLINGAGGGVGTFAVQIAKSFDADVTAVCGTHNVEKVRSIGADHVIDYTKEDFTKKPQRYDLIIAANGYHWIMDYRRALNPSGIYVVLGGSMAQLLQALMLGSLVSRFGNKKMGFLLSHADQADLVLIKELLESGKVKPVIDRCYPLSETAEAIRYLEAGHARGKVVITVANNGKSQ